MGKEFVERINYELYKVYGDKLFSLSKEEKEDLAEKIFNFIVENI